MTAPKPEHSFRFNDLADKTLLITGITRGIGRALLPGLLAQGLNLIAVSLGLKEMEAVRAELGVDETRLRLFECDLAQPAAVEATGRAIAASGLRIDGVLHNAGIDPRHRFEKTGGQPWDSIWQVNVRSAATLTQHLLPQLRRSGHGRVVFTGSVVSEMGGIYMTAYATSKAAVMGLTRSLAHELHGSGITVNCILPGAIQVEKEAGNTVMDEKLISWQSVGRRLTPNDLLGPLCLLLSEAGSGISGQCLTVDGGLIHPLMSAETQSGRLKVDGYE
ncbi:MAG: SDR family oxidoreductase [Opitutaceae bacterium]|nr:SDR family oxidoreductase [Opitutaceae bacterium]MBP9912859.1 SDR family oxidoreductase [Opitutaceae bacterium]